MNLLETILALDGPYVVWLKGPQFYELAKPYGRTIPARGVSEYKFGGVRIALLHEPEVSATPFWTNIEIDAALGGLGQ